MGFYTLVLCTLSVLATRQVTGCGYNVKAIDREQTISSPGYPVGYPQHQMCTWTIQANYGSHVFINITHFDLGSGDSLSISDGSNDRTLMASYSSMTSLAGKQSTFTTKTNSALLQFRSNYGQVNNAGFSLQFIMDCLDNAKCSSLGATAACADQAIGETFCPKLCGSCPHLISQLLG